MGVLEGKKRSAEEHLISKKPTGRFKAECTHPCMSLSQCPHRQALQRRLFMVVLDSFFLPFSTRPQAIARRNQAFASLLLMLRLKQRPAEEANSKSETVSLRNSGLPKADRISCHSCCAR
ncbi:uncharacterized protein LJ206_008035 [Theristicus caerulescens]